VATSLAAEKPSGPRKPVDKDLKLVLDVLKGVATPDGKRTKRKAEKGTMRLWHWTCSHFDQTLSTRTSSRKRRSRAKPSLSWDSGELWKGVHRFFREMPSSFFILLFSHINVVTPF